MIYNILIFSKIFGTDHRLLLKIKRIIYRRKNFWTTSKTTWKNKNRNSPTYNKESIGYPD